MSYRASHTGGEPADFTQQSGIWLLELTAGIVSAYVSKNPVPPIELPVLIGKVHAVVSSLPNGASQPKLKDIEKPTAAQIRKSITPDGLISFEDGNSYKTLKRHLTACGLDPQSYRERYGLPADYPMVAPSYALKRSKIAKALGLGRIAG